MSRMAPEWPEVSTPGDIAIWPIPGDIAICCGRLEKLGKQEVRVVLVYLLYGANSQCLNGPKLVP